MKLLHLSDLHIGKSLYDFPLLDDIRFVLDYIVDTIISEHIGAVIIAGDVFDRPVPSQEAVRVYDAFLARVVLELGVPVIAIAGNHDSGTRLEFGSGILSHSGYHVCGNVRLNQPPVTLTDEFGDVNIYPIPWFHPADLRAQLDADTAADAQIKTFDSAYKFLLDDITKNINPTTRNIAVAHGFFAKLDGSAEKEILTSDSEINIGGMDIVDAAYFAPFDYTALGHLHAPQKAHSDSIRYSGSPLKYSISEEKQKKSATIVELKAKGDVAISQIKLPCKHDVRTITGSFDDLMEPSYHINKNFDDYVFATIVDSEVIFPMIKLRTLFPNLLGITFKNTGDSSAVDHAPLTADTKLTLLELFSMFYKDAKSQDMPDDRLEYLREVIADSDWDSEVAQ